MSLLYKLLAKSESKGLVNLHDNFSGNGSMILFWKMLCIIAIICTLIIAWQKLIQNNQAKTHANNSPEKLFEDLLVQLELSDDHKKLLRQMTKQSRLKQPTIALLSPTMLAGSCDLWLKEKGPEIVTDQKIQQLSFISEQLFGA